MCATLETLELAPEELDLARERVRWMAHEKWEKAGRPMGESLRFWLEAEHAWIEHEYVPHRDDIEPM